MVIAHGTDTMEETASALELRLAPQKPVVLTGAPRHRGDADSDGPRKLRDALIAAADPALGAAGVGILFEGDIHGARHVRKTHTSRVDTFRAGDSGKAGDFGKIGAIESEQLRLRSPVAPRPWVLRGSRPRNQWAKEQGSGGPPLLYCQSSPLAPALASGRESTLFWPKPTYLHQISCSADRSFGLTYAWHYRRLKSRPTGLCRHCHFRWGPSDPFQR